MNRKRKQAIIRFFTVFFMLCTIYILYCLLLSKTQDHVISNKETQNNKRFDIRNVTPEKISIRKKAQFQKEDMEDEFGQPYKIVVWSDQKLRSKPVMNPYLCLANVSCKVVIGQRDSDSAHAIVFKAEELVGDFVLPTNRKPFQLYTWWTRKSPLYTPEIPDSLDDYFNLTFHYRSDADIYSPLGSLKLVLNELKRSNTYDIDRLLEAKDKANKIAAWVDNKCFPDSFLFGKSLIELGLEVDTFGDCFQTSSPKIKMESFFFEYKFFLAFDDSFDCKDYFTQNFWHTGMVSGAVPVVWGPRKEDLIKVTPTKSFIHAADFATPLDLVNYLNYLATDVAAYSEYLDWRIWAKYPFQIEERLLQNSDFQGFCKLCSILQIDGKRRKMKQQTIQRTVPSLTKAWFGPESEKCYKRS